MTRKEKHAAAEAKRQGWYDAIVRKFQDNLATSNTVGEAAEKTDRWLSQALELEPREKALIMGAAIQVRTLVEQVAKSTAQRLAAVAIIGEATKQFARDEGDEG